MFKPPQNNLRNALELALLKSNEKNANGIQNVITRNPIITSSNMTLENAADLKNESENKTKRNLTLLALATVFLI